MRGSKRLTSLLMAGVMLFNTASITQAQTAEADFSDVLESYLKPDTIIDSEYDIDWNFDDAKNNDGLGTAESESLLDSLKDVVDKTTAQLSIVPITVASSMPPT